MFSVTIGDEVIINTTVLRANRADHDSRRFPVKGVQGFYTKVAFKGLLPN